MVDKSEETFMDISKESSSNSVWKYFLRGKTNQVAKCMQCMQVLKILGGCTTPMHTHLRSKHNTVLNKRKFDENTAASTSDSNDSVVSTTRKTNTIIDFFKSKKGLAVTVSKTIKLINLEKGLFGITSKLRITSK